MKYRPNLLKFDGIGMPVIHFLNRINHFMPYIQILITSKIYQTSWSKIVIPEQFYNSSILIIYTYIINYLLKFSCTVYRKSHFLPELLP